MNAHSPRVFAAPSPGIADPRHTLGIVGAGKLGRAIGGSAADGGWRVLFHDAAVTEPLRTELASSAPTARLTGLAELASQADLIVLAVPFGAADGLDYTLFDGKIVLDAMNHWAPVDGEMPELAAYPQGTSALVAGRGPGMRMVKSLNHLSYHDYTTDARSPEVTARRAVAVATDDRQGARLVGALVNDLGFDPVPVPWDRGRLLEPGGPVFGRWLTAQQMRELLA